MNLKCNHITAISFKDTKALYSYNRHILRRFFPIILILILFTGCATITTPPIPEKPLSANETLAIISNIKDQEEIVDSFYSTGRVVLKDWKWDSEADFLIAGEKTPLRIKIEITHPWGKPILHLLIDNESLEILSFQDKVLYRGSYTPETLSRFLPIEIDTHLMWAVVRGYPYILDHTEVVSRQGNQFSLINSLGHEVEIIDLYPESYLPRQAYFPLNQVNLLFSDIQDLNGIQYAKEVKVKSDTEKKGLVLKNSKMVFNRSIPEKIFSLKKPPSFRIIDLDNE